jgi:WD40 repeat protein
MLICRDLRSGTGCGTQNSDDTSVCTHGHQRSITALAWSPDGELLASGSADRSIKLWQIS